jgi:hypothetical protein
MNARHVALLAMLSAGLSFASACAGDLESPNRFSKLLGVRDASAQPLADAAANAEQDSGVMPAPACVVQAFRNTCGTSTCHAKGTDQVDLVSDGVAARLLDKPAHNVICKGRTLLATDGSASLLVQKLNGMPPCGVPMPVTGMLTPRDRQCVFAWVTSVGGSVPDAGAR